MLTTQKEIKMDLKFQSFLQILDFPHLHMKDKNIV